MYRVYSTARTGSFEQTAAVFLRDPLHSVIRNIFKMVNSFFQIPVNYHQPSNSDLEFIKSVPCFASFTQFCTEQISENIVGS